MADGYVRNLTLNVAQLISCLKDRIAKGFNGSTESTSDQNMGLEQLTYLNDTLVQLAKKTSAISTKLNQTAKGKWYQFNCKNIRKQKITTLSFQTLYP